MLVVGAGSLAVGLAIGEAGALDPGRVSAASAWCWLHLVQAGSVLTFSAYAWLLRSAPVSHVATHAYVNPVVAVLLGWLVLGESISGLTALSASLIVLSVVATLAPARAWPWQRVRLAGSRRPAAGALRTNP